MPTSSELMAAAFAWILLQSTETRKAQSSNALLNMPPRTITDQYMHAYANKVKTVSVGVRVLQHGPPMLQHVSARGGVNFEDGLCAFFACSVITLFSIDVGYTSSFRIKRLLVATA